MSDESSTIDVPVAGPIKKTYVYVGVAVVAGILGYAWFMHRQAPADETVVEPPFEDYTGGLQTGGSGTTTAGIPYQSAPPPDDEDLPPATNPAWVTRGVDYLQNLAFDAQLVAVTLGKYLARVPLTMAEADIVRTVEGALGRPPTGEYRIIMVGTPPAPAPTPIPPPAPPAPAPAPPVVPERESVPWGVNLYDWTRAIGAKYGIPYDFDRMVALNPGIRNYMQWLPTKPDKTPIFWKPTPAVRIR